MIEAHLASQTRALEKRLLVHARRLIDAHAKRARISRENAWRSPDLLWPNFTQDD